MSHRAARLRLGPAIACFVIALLVGVKAVTAEVVRFTTNLGTFDVNLSTSGSLATTVDNFLSYVRAGAYTSSIIHRSTTYDPAAIQIVQGGGYAIQGSQIVTIPTAAPIPLEAGVANTRGTIAMARTAVPNSATSGWYFNVEDNSGLDFNYAVFGNVIDTADNPGLRVVDAIGTVPVYNAEADLGVAFGELPLLEATLAPQSLVLVESVAVLPPAAGITIGVAAGRTVTQLATGYPVLTGTVPVVKTGDGTLVVGGTNTATGPLEIQAGSLAVPSAVAVAGFGSLTAASDATLDVAALTGGYTVPAAQTLGGSGTVLGSLTFGAGATLAPGDGLAVAPSVMAVPEPGAAGAVWALVACGGMALARRRARSTPGRHGHVAHKPHISPEMPRKSAVDPALLGA